MNIRNKFLTGFTLIEILVVVSIIGFLTTIVLVSLNSAKEKAQETAGIQQLKEVKNAINMFYSDKGYYPGGDISVLETNLSGGSKIYISEITPNPQLMYFGENNDESVCTDAECPKYSLTLWDKNNAKGYWNNAVNTCVLGGKRLPDVSELGFALKNQFVDSGSNPGGFIFDSIYWSNEETGSTGVKTCGFQGEWDGVNCSYIDLKNEEPKHFRCVR